MNYEWFVAYVKGLSRQRVTTIVKPIGLTAHRWKDHWAFRDSTGRELELRDVFDALMNAPETRSRLERDYSYPLRSEQDWRERQTEERRASLAKIADACRFLIDDLEFSQPFEIPTTLDNTWILAYRNAAANRQVEVSGQREDWFHCQIRKLLDGEPGQYRTQSFGDWEIRFFRERRPIEQEPYLTGDELLATITATLKRNTDLLVGDHWLDRAQLDAAFEQDMRRRGLLSEPGTMHDRTDVEQDVRRIMTRELGFAITFDSDALSPHERQMWKTYRYERDGTVIELANTDIRIPTEWSLEIDGEVVANTIEDILRVVEQLRDQ